MQKLYRGKDKVVVGEYIVGLRDAGCGDKNLTVFRDRIFVVKAISYPNITIGVAEGKTTSGVGLYNDSEKDARFRRGYKNEQRF